MFHKQIPVASKDTKSALIDFINYLQSLPGKVILLAHNAKFDMSFLRHALEASCLSLRFQEVCIGFICTLSMADAKLPKSINGPVDHKISGLLEFYYGEVEVELHDSAADVLALESIFECMQESVEELAPHSFSVCDFWMHHQTISRAKGIILEK
jgi:DNA polymerase III epsilon subunit-like protein